MAWLAVAVLGGLAMVLPCQGLDNGVGLTPPMGWSTWCTGGKCGNDYCSEDLVLQGADALVSTGMKELGWNYIVLDDCWEDSRDNATHQLTADPVKFPNGMKAVADKLHSMGIQFGLYLSAGDRTCNSHGENHSVPGSEGYYQQDVNTLAAWDVDYVKLDWCGDVHSEPLKGPGLYKNFSNALNHSVPSRPMFFEAVAGYIFLLRDAPKYFNSWRDMTDHHDTWQTTSNTIEAQADLALTGRPGGWGYMDILTTGGEGCPTGSGHCPGQTDTEYKTEFSLWSLTQSPLFVATDIRNMTPVMKAALLNKEILRHHQDTRTPPGKRLHFYGCSEFRKCSVWTRHLADGSVLVALYNAGTKNHTIEVRLEALNSTAKHGAAVVDLWNHAGPGPTPVVAGAYSAVVPAHGIDYVQLIFQ